MRDRRIDQLDEVVRQNLRRQTDRDTVGTLRQQQREPTVEQIAQELELPREEVVFAMDAMSAPVSLYEPVYADGGDAVCVMDQIRDDHSSDEGWLQQLALKDAISHLQPRERNILALRFCQGKT